MTRPIPAARNGRSSRVPRPGGRLRIAQVAPPMEAVPPQAYGGIERVVAELSLELQRRGHEVTVFASGDSSVAAPLVPTAPRALRPAELDAQASAQVLVTMNEVIRRADDFDLIHDHLEWAGIVLARACRTPVLTTFHGRLDRPFARAMLDKAPAGLVAISENQAAMHPAVPWTAVVHNGLSLDQAPVARRRDDALVFVGRICAEKGVVDAIEVARRTGRKLKIAAKIGPMPDEQAYAESVFRPALKTADTEFVGELSTTDRDLLIAGSHALLMPGAWPEPFGLVAIEALACGTPVIARRVGALPEVIRDGKDGFFADDAEQMAFLVDRVDGLDRTDIRTSVMERFSTARMADGYEAAYIRLLGGPAATMPDDGTMPNDGAMPNDGEQQLVPSAVGLDLGAPAVETTARAAPVGQARYADARSLASVRGRAQGGQRHALAPAERARARLRRPETDRALGIPTP